MFDGPYYEMTDFTEFKTRWNASLLSWPNGHRIGTKINLYVEDVLKIIAPKNLCTNLN